MKRHPGGLAQSRRLLELAGLRPGCRVLDLGAGAGETLRLLREQGFAAQGLDLEPRGEGVERGDMLHAPYPDESFDALLSECSFFVSGDVPGALAEARRLLRPGGLLLLADVFFEAPGPLLEAAGFSLRQAEERTAEWKDYYLEALWRGEDCGCVTPKGKSAYWLLIAGKE